MSIYLDPVKGGRAAGRGGRGGRRCARCNEVPRGRGMVLEPGFCVLETVADGIPHLGTSVVSILVGKRHRDILFFRGGWGAVDVVVAATLVA